MPSLIEQKLKTPGSFLVAHILEHSVHGSVLNFPI